MPRRVYAAISGHGFGHLAQLAPVLNALRQRLPGTELVVQSTLPDRHLHRHIDGSFLLIAEPPDVGLVMKGALDVEVESTFAAYRAFHEDWPERVRRVVAQLQSVRADIVVADAPYLVCAAGARTRLPTLALCSLNWADIFRHYCGEMAGADRIQAEIEAAYNSADAFLRPAPAMTMPTLANTQPIGPIGRVGQPSRDRLRRRLGVDADTRLLMVSLGGIESRLPVENWPADPRLRFIVPASWEVVRPDVAALEDLGMSYLDAMCSCDALITKLGYGHVADAACNGVPLLYVERGDWPEEPVLRDWLQRRGRCAGISRSDLNRGDIEGPLAELLAQSLRPKVKATGIEEAVEALMFRLA